jgi:hypothetical protein
MAVSLSPSPGTIRQKVKAARAVKAFYPGDAAKEGRMSDYRCYRKNEQRNRNPNREKVVPISCTISGLSTAMAVTLLRLAANFTQRKGKKNRPSPRRLG